MSDQRTAFELWAKEQGYDLTRGSWGERYMDDQTWVAYQGWSAAVGILRPASNDLLMRETAAALAHRGCCGTEHDAANGKLHGYCIVCGVPWPCETAQYYLRPAAETRALPTLRRFRPVVEGGRIRSMAEVGNPNGFGGWNAEYVLASDYDELARGELKASAGDPS